MRELREQWGRCFGILSLRPPEGTFESLAKRYSEPQRAYHTLQHISECFEQFDRIRDADSAGAVGLVRLGVGVKSLFGVSGQLNLS